MATEPQEILPDLRAPRARTDESLQQERELADLAIAEKHAEVAEKTVWTVEEVRADTDESLQRGRVEADLTLEDVRQEAAEIVETLAEAVPEAAEVGEVIAQERQLADEVIRRERERADEVLRQERERADAALDRERRERRELRERLLERERRQTDRNLAQERARADEVVEQLAEQAGKGATEVGTATRDEILAIVSHDLRDPLNTIALSADLMRENAPSGEGGVLIRGLAGTVQRCVGQMTTMIGDLLDLERIAAGRLRLQVETRDAVAVAREALERAHPTAAAKGIALAAELPAPPVPTLIDRDRVLQVLANLLGNALKFTDEGGRVTVRLERRAHDVRFSVRDTGSGIPADKLEGIFERFAQVNGDGRSGLGLGLYISRWIVEQHGGTIEVESKEGVGSTFSFTLPLA